MPKWKVGSLFAGVGGFDLGFEQTGKFETVWMSEWDKHAEGVLRRRFPGAKQIGDITKVDPAGLEPVDVVVGGFPCQDLSVAGKRAGLAGERSGLFHEFVRIVRGLPVRPSFIVVENVPGMLSSQQGRDFAVVLSEVAESWGAVSSRGESWTVSTSEWPNDAVVASLSSILEPNAPRKYWLSSKAAAGILRRASRRNKKLPRMLQEALEAVILSSADTTNQELAAKSA